MVGVGGHDVKKSGVGRLVEIYICTGVFPDPD
jgi:hypothetical protein